jgi:cobalt transporter subunit CbtA
MPGRSGEGVDPRARRPAVDRNHISPRAEGKWGKNVRSDSAGLPRFDTSRYGLLRDCRDLARHLVYRRHGICAAAGDPRRLGTTPDTRWVSPVTDGVVMFQLIFATALGARISVGLLIAALRYVALVPLILTAETYESGAHQHATKALDIGKPITTHVNALVFADEAQADEHSAPNPGEAVSPWRPVFTPIATTLTAIGFALLLTRVFAMSGRDVEMRDGVLSGLAGFATCAFAPASGLPPELPGSVAAELVARQIWWLATASTTASGLALMVFVRAPSALLIGVALLIAPHLIGAAQSPEGTGVVPPELAAAFAGRSLVVNAVFWALLGLAAGALCERLGRTAKA